MVCRLVAVAISTLLLLTQLPTGTGSLDRPVLSCFLQAWSIYRPSHGRFDEVDVDPSLCTHVVYAFVGLDNQTNRITSRDAFAVESGAFKKLLGLKLANPALVVTVALGGWSEGSAKYSNMVSSRETRKTFVESVVQYLGIHSLDGLHLGWQDPASRGGSSSDKQNYVLLSQELSEEFRPRGWHLTVGVSARQYIVDKGYDLQELVKYVDLVYVQTTDYHGAWDGFTGHVAPLYPRDDEKGNQRQNNVNSTLSFILSDVPPEKVVLTVPLYGRTFLLKKPSDNGYGAPVLPAGFPGPYTQEDGLLGYNEICELLSFEAGQWTVHRSTIDASPYAVSGHRWFSYDDHLSISKKVEVVRSSHLAGVSVLGVDNDDFKGRCGEGPYPLLTHIKNRLVATPAEPAPKQMPPVKACFLASESLKRESLGKFTVEDIDPSLCTHVVFCYATLNNVTGGIDDKDPVYVADGGAFAQLVALKARNPDLLVHVAIGGWEDGALSYSIMASTPESRATFVQSVVAYLRLRNLDGLNLDWQDPATRGGIGLDKQNYVLLCQELRAAFQPHGWQLTVSVSAHKRVLDAGYDLSALASHVDLLYVASFAYHGPWEGHTGSASPLYPRDEEEGDQRFLNMNFTLSYILSQDVPAYKVVPALPFTFRTYILLSRHDDGVGAPSKTEGFSGFYTKAYSSVAYYEICQNIRQPSTWKVRYEPQQRVPYMVQREKWIGYEDNDSIREKMTLASRLGVGGVMVWTVDADDFRGSCGLGRYPLLNAISREMASWSGTPGGNASAGGGACEFRCGDGRCIGIIEICNGRKDCSDGSDETRKICANWPCRNAIGLEEHSGEQSFGLGDKGIGSFRCEYGGCITTNFKCNGFSDCADDSDETAEVCKDTNCDADSFRCDYGACISRYDVCDNVENCHDGSDERHENCKFRASLRRVVCPKRTKKYCDNHRECYERRKQCDGKFDCADKSDEKAELCHRAVPVPTPPPTTTPRTTAPDTPPPVKVEESCLPPNCRCSLPGLEHFCLPCGEIADLNATCLSLDNEAVCSMTVEASVSVDVLSCGAQAHVMTAQVSRVTQSCVNRHKMVPSMTLVYADCWGVSSAIMRCHSDGYWRAFGARMTGSDDFDSYESFIEKRPMKQLCQPYYVNSQVCGRRPRYKSSGKAVHLTNSHILENRWPWVMGLKNSGRYQCSATLISPRFLLTAAHCVIVSQETNRTIDVGVLKVQNSHSHVPVSEIILHPAYEPGLEPLNDLALIRLEKPLLFNSKLYPACVDLHGIVFPLAYIAVTFGRHNGENRFLYNVTLQQIDTSCFTRTSRWDGQEITEMRFCGTDLENYRCLVGGSSGGPFLQNFGSDDSEEWTVSGVVSFCNNGHTVFTATHAHKTWITASVHNEI